MTTNTSTVPPISSIGLPPSVEENAKQGLQVLIALFGVVGNLLVILVVGRQPRKKSATDVYVQILSVADLLVLSVNFPLAVIKERLPTNWPFGEFSCLYLYPIPDTFYGASVWTIVAIAVERYRGIVLGTPMSGRTVLSRAKKTAACLWAVSFLVFALPLYFFMKYEEKAMDKLCSLTWPLHFFQTYTIVLLLCSYVLPLACICWTCVQVRHSLLKSNLFIKTMYDGRYVTTVIHKGLSHTEVKRLYQNKRANRILTPVAVVFAVSMLPLAVFRTILPFKVDLYNQTFYHHLIYVTAVGAIINSAANPLIYSLSCKDFRAGLKLQFFCQV